MVRLQKLVLRNFKSFKKADIPLSKGFTVIVGSNGSGKTNILDGLLFALGISSMKMLRVSKIEELVNTAAVESYAKAELTIKAGDRTYTVQRMIDKQGKSVYRLDGKRKTRNEISSLLLELGIKPEGHNIVVQGDTTRVVEMSPVERRQIIDELAGLQEFDAKKEEALKELQKVDNKTRDAGIVMQEREIYLGQLRQDKEAAAEYESLQKERRQGKATLLFSEVESIEKAEKECIGKLEEIEKAKREVEKEGEEGHEKKKVLKEESEKLNKEILSQRERTYATLGGQLEEAKTKKALAEQGLENMKVLVERNEARVTELGKRAEKAEKEEEGQKERVKEIEAELESMQKDLNEAAQKRAELQAVVQEKEKRAARLNEGRERASAELESVNREMLEKAPLLKAMQKETELKKEAMRETMGVIENLESKAEEREKKAVLLSQLGKKYGNLEEKLEEAEKAREKALDKVKEAEAERKNIAEGIEMLGKNFASCPVCEAELEKEKRKKIMAKKEARMKEIMERERSLRQSKLDWEARLREARNAAEKGKKLGLEIQDLAELRASLNESRQKLSSIKQWLSANSPERAKAEVEKLKQLLGKKKLALAAQEEKARSFRESSGLEELEKAINAVSQLEKKENSLRQEKESILGSTEKHLKARKQEALKEAESLKEENVKAKASIKEGGQNLHEITKKISSLEAKLGEEEKAARKMVEEKERVEANIARLEESLRKGQAKLRSLSQEENAQMIEKSKREVRLADLKEEFEEFKGEERLESFEKAALNERLKEIAKRIEKLGAINMKALESYNQLEAEVLDVRKKVEKLEEERLAVIEMIEKIDVKRTSVFMECFEALNKNFSKMFNSLFNGEGRLELSNRESPLEAGLLIEAKHKGDSIRNIDSMSGGEKTMTALAFLFAIQVYEPAPFYVFDEADAALDKENSMKMAKIIKEISKQSQFIAITHNDPLVQEADQIIGVALNKQKSSVIGLKLREKFKN